MTTLCLAELDDQALQMLGRRPDDRCTPVAAAMLHRALTRDAQTSEKTPAKAGTPAHPWASLAVVGGWS